MHNYHTIPKHQTIYHAEGTNWSKWTRAIPAQVQFHNIFVAPSVRPRSVSYHFGYALASSMIHADPLAPPLGYARALFGCHLLTPRFCFHIVLAAPPVSLRHVLVPLLLASVTPWLCSAGAWLRRVGCARGFVQLQLLYLYIYIYIYMYIDIKKNIYIQI